MYGQSWASQSHTSTRWRFPKHLGKQTRRSDAASSPIVQLPVCCGRPWHDLKHARQGQANQGNRLDKINASSFASHLGSMAGRRTTLKPAFHPTTKKVSTLGTLATRSYSGAVQDAYHAGVHCPSHLLPLS